MSLKIASDRVKEDLNANHLNKKAMIDHIKTIMDRKCEIFDEIKKHKNVAAENEKK